MEGAPVIRTTGRSARRHLVRYWTTTGRTKGRPTDLSSGPSAHRLLVRPYGLVGFSRLIRVSKVRIMIRVRVRVRFSVNIGVRVITILMAPSVRHVEVKFGIKSYTYMLSKVYKELGKEA